MAGAVGGSWEVDGWVLGDWGLGGGEIEGGMGKGILECGRGGERFWGID